MPITFEATYKKGVLKPNEKLQLPEGSRVHVTITPMDDASDFLAGVIGIGTSGRSDGAARHDSYLYKKKRP